MSRDSLARTALAETRRLLSPGRRAALFMVVAASLWLWDLGNVPLRDWDEATFAQVSREMVEAGRWLHPTTFGQPYLHKPPLLFWLMAASYSLSGVSEAAARLPGALISAMAVPLLYLAGRRIFDRETPAVMAAAVYLTLLPVVRHGRLAMMDGAVNTLFIAALLCLFRGMSSKRWLTGVGIALGLIALAKSVVALAVGAMLGVFLVIARRHAVLRSGWLWLGLGIGFAPVSAWLVLQVNALGFDVLRVLLLEQGVARAIHPVDHRGGPWWFYVFELLKFCWPWVICAVAGIGMACRSRRDAWARLVLVCGGGYLAMISVMATKLPWYVMPCYIFLALAAGAYLARLWHDGDTPARRPAWGLFAFAVLAAAALVYQTNVARHAPPMAAGVTAIAACAAAGILAWRGRRVWMPLLVAGLYVALFLFVSSPSWNWELNEAFDVKPVARMIVDHVPPGVGVRTTLPYRRPSLDFYAGRLIVPLGSRDDDDTSRGSAYVLIDESRADNATRSQRRLIARIDRFALVAPW
jgi:4-amino-4-deoxy-L-arabinose transferase-like glycosyltransferase